MLKSRLRVNKHVYHLFFCFQLMYLLRIYVVNKIYIILIEYNTMNTIIWVNLFSLFMVNYYIVLWYGLMIMDYLMILSWLVLKINWEKWTFTKKSRPFSNQMSKNCMIFISFHSVDAKYQLSFYSIDAFESKSFYSHRLTLEIS